MNRRIIPNIYLWLLPILSVPGLYIIRNNVSLEIYLLAVFVHLSLLSVSMYVLRPQSITKKRKSILVAAILLLVGATSTFISATTFSTTALEAISKDKFGHYWTSAGFYISQILFLSGLTYLNTVIETKNIRTHKIGYLLMLVGGVLWLLHLTYRLTIMVWAADHQNETGRIPESYEMLTLWAGSFYVSYMTLTYLGFIAYGLALKKMNVLPQWLATGTLVFGIATPLLFALGIGPFRMPIAIQLIPWLIGIYLIKNIGKETDSTSIQP